MCIRYFSGKIGKWHIYYSLQTSFLFVWSNGKGRAKPKDSKWVIFSLPQGIAIISFAQLEYIKRQYKSTASWA